MKIIEVSSGKLLNKKEEIRLSRIIRDPEKLERERLCARNKLIEANTRLVVRVARSFIRKGVEFFDLVQEGNCGLITAAERFDWRKGFKFSTYAIWWIRQAMQRVIAGQSRTIRVPVYIHEQLGHVLSAYSSIYISTGEKPSLSQVADKTGYSESMVKALIGVYEQSRTISIDWPANNGDGCDYEERMSLENFVCGIPNKNFSPFDYVFKQERKGKVKKILSEILTVREFFVIKNRFSLFGCEPHTLEEIGGMLGVTRERIRQIEVEAIKKLKKSAYLKSVKEDLC